MRLPLAPLLLLAACSGAPAEPESPEVNPTTVPSLALLGTAGQRESATQSGSGMSCEDVIDRERRRAEAGEAVGEEPDLEHNDAIKEALNTGEFLNTCNVETTAGVVVCAAILNGRADGVTVTIDPGNPEEAACVADAIRRIDFPVHELVSVARTAFDPR